ncbi:MAG TPA: glycosyltransferase family 4 protein [Terriglobia bacterium]|nr:glycosyltransferase family 4 protein [Terriglobia bacterium]
MGAKTEAPKPIAATVDSKTPHLRLLALSSPGGFSGLPEAVLGQLGEHCEVVSVIDGLKVPRLDRLRMAARTVRPRRGDWGRGYYAALGRYTKRPSTLRKRIRRCEGELNRLQGSYDVIYQFGALFGALKRPCNAPLILHIDFTTGLAEKYYPAWLPESPADTEEWFIIEERIYQSADLILVPTHLVSRSLSEHYHVNAAKIAVVGMGAHIDDLAEDFAKRQNRVLVFAGPDFHRHGGELALQIFEGVRGHSPDATLTTVTNRSVKAAGVRNIGIVSRTRLHEILKQAAVLLMPGAVGGYQTVTEAMAAKCLCVVAEDNPHMSGLIRNDENGLTVTAASIAQTADAIAGYLKSADRLRAIGENARRHVVGECSWPRIVDRIWREIETRFPTWTSSEHHDPPRALQQC